VARGIAEDYGDPAGPEVSGCSSSAHLGQLEMAKRGWGWEFGAAQGHNKQLVVGWLS